MKLATLAISFVILYPVVAPPPLDVELRAKKEFYDELNDAKEDVLDVFGDNLIPDSIEDVIEDSNTEDPIEIKSDESSEFVPVSIPNKFDKYDSNDDDFIDEGELLAILGVTENENVAFKAADDDGDGMLSRDEFENGPWDLDSGDVDLSDDNVSDDKLEESVDDVIEDFIDFDDDEFENILENQISDDVKSNEIDNDIVDDIIDDVKDKVEDKVEIINDIVEDITDNMTDDDNTIIVNRDTADKNDDKRDDN
ncbi:germ cell nuclear acidic protein-like [Mytilus trossulus]|uniref:germ cell nuclear acidic protein-like n=1 Tax=Mytilus trossulus TaxID=6551 RepID=UPI0030042F49